MKIIKQLSIAIVSDLHCTSSDDQKVSHLMSHTHRNPKLHHPVEALKNLINENQVKSDVVLCPGDVTDNIDPTGFHVGWEYIQEIGRDLGTNMIIASLGNHDLDSRNKDPNQSEPTYSAKNINDNYPFEGDTSKYWKDHFDLINLDDLIILNINSCASHLSPIYSDGKFVDVKTSLDETTLEKISEKIENLDKDKFKIALLHHHPNQYSDLILSSYKDRDILQGGDKLLKELQSKSFDIVVHGHKHVPRFIVENDLPVFCSGSFSSLQNLQETDSKNTFHLLNLMIVEKADGSKENVGELLTWEFTKGHGWAKTTDLNSKIEHRIGFGLNNDLNQLADNIYNYAHVGDLKIIELEDLYDQFSSVKYLSPFQMEKLFSLLKNKHGYSKGMEEDGSTILIKKRDG